MAVAKGSRISTSSPSGREEPSAWKFRRGGPPCNRIRSDDRRSGLHGGRQPGCRSGPCPTGRGVKHPDDADAVVESIESIAVHADIHNARIFAEAAESAQVTPGSVEYDDLPTSGVGDKKVALIIDGGMDRLFQLAGADIPLEVIESPVGDIDNDNLTVAGGGDIQLAVVDRDAAPLAGVPSSPINFCPLPACGWWQIRQVRPLRGSVTCI